MKPGLEAKTKDQLSLVDTTPAPTNPPPPRRLRKVLWWLIAVGLSLIVILIAGVRLAPPYINDFRPQIAALVSDLVGQTVSISHLEAEWRSWNTMELKMSGVSLLNEAGTESVLELKRARVTIDVIQTAIKGELRPGNLVVAGARIALIREPDGTFAAQGLDEDERTPAPGETANTQRDAYASWMLSQQILGLESATLIWHDLRSGHPPITLTDVNIRTSFDGKSQHRVSGSATLPPELGQTLRFDLSILGDPLSRDWSGSVSLRADGVHLSALTGLRDLGITAADGKISVDVDTDWTKTRLRTSAGSYRLEDAQLNWSVGASSIEVAAGRFRLERDEGGWKLELAQQQFESRYGAWPPMEARVALARGKASGQPSTFTAIIDFARIEDLLPMLASLAPRELQPALGRLTLQGDLERVEIGATVEDGEPKRANVDAIINNLSTPTRGHVPGLSGLSGHLQADLSQGRFVLDSDTLAVTIPGVFTQPLRLSKAAGEIGWRRLGTGWWFETEGLSLANDELAGTVIGKLHWPYGNTLPILDMGVSIDSADLAHLDSFLPVGLLRPRFAGWMQRALKAGQLRDARFWYRGYAGDFPFDSGDEGFRASGRFEELDLQYSSRWPDISRMAATFRAEGETFELTATTGQVFGSVIDGGTARIPDLSLAQPTLHVETRLSGAAANGLQFLREGILAKRFGDFAGALDTTGDIQVDLDVLAVLPAGKKQASGNITLLGNTLALKEVDITLTETRGQLSFTPEGVSASGIEAVYLDTPISIDVARSQPGNTELLIKGSADKAFLLRQLHNLALFADPADPPRILSHIQGTTGWQAKVDLPDRWGRGAQPAGLQVVSNLEGLGLGLPAPFGKPVEQVKRLSIDTRFSAATGRNVKIRYGPDIGSQFELQADKDGYLLTRGAVVFGDPSPDLPTENGLFVGGRLERLSIDHWSEIMTEPARALTQTEPSDYPILRVLKEVEIRATELELLGNVFDGAHIIVAKDETNRWNVGVRGNSVQGDVTFPSAEETGKPIVIALDQLRIGKMEETLERGNRYDPRRFPPLKFSTRNLFYDDVNVGTIKFSTTPRYDGLSVDSLVLLADGFEASSVGTWRVRDGAHQTELVTELHADELDRLLSTLGHGESTAEGGATDILVNLEWPGSPSTFSLKSISGVVDLRSNRGRLLDVNPGATGRLVGFLMMTSLPRRLKLDFSDLFDEGIVYEFIEGSFAIENGHAYTNNLLVESEAAWIEIAGRTGLIAEDYDQVVTITPRLASSLPLAPVWLLEKVLQRNVFDKVFSYQYTITGGWDDPQIERIAIEAGSRADDEQADR